MNTANNPIMEELQRAMNLQSKHIITRGGKVVLGYNELSDTGGAEPHAQLHDMNSSSDHGTIAGEEGEVIILDSGGYLTSSYINIGYLGQDDLFGVEVTEATDASAGNYYVTNDIAEVIITLPATASFGDKIGVTGKGAGGWKLQCNTGQMIHSASSSTISGGYVKSGEYKAGMAVMCITANTDWKVIWSDGNLLMEVS